VRENPRLFGYFGPAVGIPHYPVTEITLRDLFAAAALTGWISGPCNGDTLDEYDGDQGAFAEHQAAVAKAVYGYADAMLAERSKP